jgi:hypothetical protein
MSHVHISSSFILFGWVVVKALLLTSHPHNISIIDNTIITSYLFLQNCIMFQSDRLEQILTMVYVVQSYWACLRNVVVFCFPHTRRWIKSKTSPIAMFQSVNDWSISSSLQQQFIMFNQFECMKHFKNHRSYSSWHFILRNFLKNCHAISILI